MVVCRVILLDGENFQVEIPKNALGRTLFENVSQKLSLEEADYFGVSYRCSRNLRHWLNLDKRIDKQMESTKDMVFYWELKFYPPAPEQLNEDLTRYLIVLQIRQDLYTGTLPASFQTLAVLGSYTAQGEIGDYDKSRNSGIEYLRDYNFAPKQSEELLLRISDLHKTCKGLTPAEADLEFLTNAKKCALYGMDFYPVKDSTGREIKVGVSASGLYIYHGRLRMEAYKWPRILKISYKTTVFYVKVRPAEFERDQKTLGFKLPTAKLAKRLWRISVENHQFFRLKQPELTDTSTLRGFGGRKWRMSGRTQSQLRNVGTPRKSFSRCNSIMSSDTYPGFHQSTSTMPVPATRHYPRETDVNRNYNTVGGRVIRGTDPLVDISMDDSGEYIPGESVGRASVPRDSHNNSRVIVPSVEAVPSGEADKLRTDNLINGEVDGEYDSDLLPSHSFSSHRTPNGQYQYRKPVPKERVPSRGAASLHSPNIDNTEPGESNMIIAAGAPQLSNANSPPSPAGRSLDSVSKSPAKERYPSTSSTSRHQPPSQLPAVSRFGVGELPMPSFSLGSAGVMPTGGIDHSVKLGTSERCEKVINVGVPPTVKTTSMKFAGGSSEPSTRSTWSPPTVKTEKKQFNYIPDSKPEMNGYHKPGHERILQTTTTCTTERDGYIEKKVKHTITVSGDGDLDDKLLLDAIQAVTGLDSTLGVDKIEIKTETESP